MRKPKDAPVRLYVAAEAYIEDLSLSDGKTERVIKLRFKTDDVVGPRPSKGLTPWVTFILPAMEQLSGQLAMIVETAKRWEPSAEAPDVSSTAGITVRQVSPPKPGDH